MNMSNKEEKSLKGSVTVEMSYVLPMVIFLIFIIIYTVFYYHDKAVLAGAVAETVEQGVEDVRNDREDGIDLDMYLKNRIGNKLIWLKTTSLSTHKTKDKIKVKVKAENKFFKTTVYLEGTVPYPEEKLREKKKAEDIIN